jgi:hypothetical protein
MIKLLKNKNGFILLIFIMAVVVASLAFTTALFSVSVVEDQRKEVWTLQKMMLCQEGLGERLSQITSEGGTDVSFVNEEGAFPSDVNDFVAKGYLKNQGLTSAGYAAKKDAWNDDLIMDSSGGRYRVRCADPTNLSKNLSLDEALYTATDVVVLIKDLTGGLTFDGDPLDNTYINTATSGLYNINGAAVKLFTYSGAGKFFLQDVSTGTYELRIVQSGTWIQDAMNGITELRFFMTVYPINNGAGTIVNKTIKLPWNEIL